MVSYLCGPRFKTAQANEGYGHTDPVTNGRDSFFKNILKKILTSFLSFIPIFARSNSS
jgi:hypothetical protein